MWEIELVVRTEKGVLQQYAIKYSIEFHGYPLGHLKKRKKIYLIATGVMVGEKIKQTINAMKKDKRFLKVESLDEAITVIVEQPKELIPVWQKDIIYLSPTIIKSNGTEILYLASWKRESLINVWKAFEKLHPTELKKIVHKKHSTISLFSRVLKLTKSQMEAIRLAKEYDYYQYPRKITIKDLAKKMNISYSTFQEHLRKAERKILHQAYPL